MVWIGESGLVGSDRIMFWILGFGVRLLFVVFSSMNFSFLGNPPLFYFRYFTLLHWITQLPTINGRMEGGKP